MRGYGESSKPEGISNYQLEHLVEDIKALVTELGYKRLDQLTIQLSTRIFS